MSLEDQLIELLAQSDFKLTELQVSRLIRYVEMLVKWNKAYNLTSIRDPSDMLVKHIMDSLMVGHYIQGDRFIDVGTGPGLPGIPLAILYPEKEFTLLDSLGKRIRFIKQVVHELEIDNVTPVQSRVEEFDPEHGFDGVISRAFASITDMVEWCHHLPKLDGGVFLALKGQLPEDEIAQLPKAFAVIDIKVLQVPELEGDRHLVLLEKKEL